MAYGTYAITKVGGLVVKLQGQHFKMDMGNGAAINHSSREIVYSGFTGWNWSYDTEGREILFLEPNAWVEFTADCADGGKVGTFLTMNGFEVEVLDLGSGGIYPTVIRASSINFTTQTATLAAKGKTAVEGDLLYGGDMLYIPTGNTGSKFKITNLCEAWRAHCPGGNEMPGLEEGFNEVNIFALDVNLDQPPLMRVRTPRPTRLNLNITK
ncbi:hypothetical protein K9N50_05305 [bacterium]|nr:hypothetical protein [bacterium]